MNHTHWTINLRSLLCGVLLVVGATFAACGGDDGGTTCSDADCLTPPPNFCDGDIAWSFLPFGACEGDSCSYSPSSTTCEFGCENGRCQDPPDLCEDVDCSAPPPTCDRDTVVTTNADGRCDPDTGTCVFTDVDIDDCTETGEICIDTDRGPECFLPDTHCQDGLRNGGETDTDCGGPRCGGCRTGQTCFEANDCRSGVCEGGTCQAASCTDSVRNGNETDRDCGGSCRPCRDSRACERPDDCTSGVCLLDVCAPASCSDGVVNGGESDVDCGGSCEPCDVGASCSRAQDCTSRACRGDRCRAPSCDDVVRNGTEADVDCGGSCPRCGPGLGCTIDAECTTGWCNGSGVCAVRTCDDGLRNGLELDVDCGGPCGLCDVDQRCASSDDCTSSSCVGGFCAPPSCIDRVRNGDESGVDCGGDDCRRCDPGERCTTSIDCADDGRCLGNRCVAPTCDDAIQNADESGIDCGGPDCSPCGRGQTCRTGADCITGICNDEGFCDIDRGCIDGVRNEDETDIDCGGAECIPCRDGWACETGEDCASGVCSLGVFCASPTCDDGVQNGLETDVDCGGPCGLDGCPSDCSEGTQLLDLGDYQLGAAFWQHTGEGEDRPTFTNPISFSSGLCGDAFFGLGSEVVYRFDVTDAGRYVIDTGALDDEPTDVDTGLYVYADTCVAFESVACAPIVDGERADLTVELDEGTYFIIIDTDDAVADTSTWTLRVTRLF